MRVISPEGIESEVEYSVAALRTAVGGDFEIIKRLVGGGFVVGRRDAFMSEPQNMAASSSFGMVIWGTAVVTKEMR